MRRRAGNQVKKFSEASKSSAFDADGERFCRLPRRSLSNGDSSSPDREAALRCSGYTCKFFQLFLRDSSLLSLFSAAHPQGPDWGFPTLQLRHLRVSVDCSAVRLES